MLWLSNLSVSSLNKIFTSIVSGFLGIDSALGMHAASLVEGSVHIYSRIQKELLPTPLRAHYTFNLRDLSKVFQGILTMDPSLHGGVESLLHLWCHEGCRVFRDRLINEEDQSWFDDAMLEQLHTTLSMPQWSIDNFNGILFANFSPESRCYKEMGVSTAGDVLVRSLEDYNIMSSSKMELVFFRDAIDHVSRINRIINQPRGNAVLVGVGGSGRRSLTKMATFIADFKCFSIEITRGYGVNEWHENLKEIIMEAGANNKNTIFLFSDTQIVHESFLEDVNNILNSGEVPNLFEADEVEKIVNVVRPLAKAAGKGLTREAILLHFISLVRSNLHVVLCMSPIGSTFRNRCRMFPSLVNCCTIDWFGAWPEEALYSVAKRVFEAQTDIDIGAFVEPLATLCNRMHRTVKTETEVFLNETKRYNYTTPTSYLELINLYVDILRTQQDKLRKNESRYRVGLDKLRETEEMVAELELSLQAMQPVLETAAIETSELLIRVSADQTEADKQAAMV